LRMIKRLMSVVGTAFAVFTVAFAGSSASFDIPQDVLDAMPEGEGRETVALMCTACHAVGLITSQRHTREEWDDVILRMTEMGFYASEEETAVIVDYLTENLGREPNAQGG
jgi:hypothetical protein